MQWKQLTEWVHVPSRWEWAGRANDRGNVKELRINELWMNQWNEVKWNGLNVNERSVMKPNETIEWAWIKRMWMSLRKRMRAKWFNEANEWKGQWNQIKSIHWSEAMKGLIDLTAIERSVTKSIHFLHSPAGMKQWMIEVTECKWFAISIHFNSNSIWLNEWFANIL